MLKVLTPMNDSQYKFDVETIYNYNNMSFLQEKGYPFDNIWNNYSGGMGHSIFTVLSTCFLTIDIFIQSITIVKESYCHTKFHFAYTMRTIAYGITLRLKSVRLSVCPPLSITKIFILKKYRNLSVSFIISSVNQNILPWSDCYSYWTCRVPIKAATSSKRSWMKLYI